MGKTAGPRHILSPRLKKGAEDRAAEKSGITPTMYLEVDGGVFLRLESTLTASSGPPQGVGRGREIGEKRKRKNERKEGRERNEKRQGEREVGYSIFLHFFISFIECQACGERDPERQRDREGRRGGDSD